MDESKFSGPITPEELDEVFGFIMANDYGVLIERQAPKENIGNSGLIVPNHVVRDRQTGSPVGTVIQVGRVAQEELDKKLSRLGTTLQPGDRVTFQVYAPVPAGLIDPDTGHPILPGLSQSRYACVEIVHYDSVIGFYIPKERRNKKDLTSTTE